MMKTEQEQISKLLHDLRAPAITLKGFSEEALLATADLVELQRGLQAGDHLPTQLARLLEDDLIPSIQTIQQVASQLSTRLDQAEVELRSGT